ncbi:hypothetical protein C8R44DRAFT_886683 [Mycena epipterygia]|nr:hypothetical protein C8R44DRAFT_886683 [Mycena epipterygia]
MKVSPIFVLATLPLLAFTAPANTSGLANTTSTNARNTAHANATTRAHQTTHTRSTTHANATTQAHQSTHSDTTAHAQTLQNGLAEWLAPLSGGIWFINIHYCAAIVYFISYYLRDIPINLAAVIDRDCDF